MIYKSVLGFLGVIAACSGENAALVRPRQFMDSFSPSGQSQIWTAKSTRDALLTGISEIHHWAQNYVDGSDGRAVASEHPYFNIMPQHQASVLSGAEPVAWSAPCFGKNSAVAKTVDNTVTITITSSEQATSDCYDYYMVLNAYALQLFQIDSDTTTLTMEIGSDITSAEQWDIDTKGFRILKFVEDTPTTIANLLVTSELFAPMSTCAVSHHAASLNMDFMATYPQFPMKKAGPHRIPDESEVHSGDFFGVVRLDGLDPMLAWAMGSTTGHTTTALWIDSELFVTESTVASSYWPTDGVQKTPYRQWLQQAQDASYQVVWAPLTEEARASYNESAAVEFFKSVEGLEYGYKTLLFGWLDTAKVYYDSKSCQLHAYRIISLAFLQITPLTACSGSYLSLSWHYSIAPLLKSEICFGMMH